MANPAHVDLLKSSIKEWNIWRAANPLIRPDLDAAHLRLSNLAGANLAGANLAGANLFRANLFRANLAGANLYMAYLSEVNAAGADLSGANMYDANLADANLAGANLYAANLSEANLGRALLVGVALAGSRWNKARLSGTVFADCDLSQTIGFGTAELRGPCTVGVDTLYRSVERTDRKVFARLGVSSLFLDYAVETIRAEGGPLFAFYSAFLSYSHGDAETADQLYELLTERSIPVWRDVHQVLPGERLDTEVDRAIRGSDKVIVLLSEASLAPGKNWWVDREVSRALDEERERSRRSGNETNILIPVDLDGYVHSPACISPHKRDLTSRLVAEYRDDRDVEPIVNALNTRYRKPYASAFDPARHNP